MELQLLWVGMLQGLTLAQDFPTSKVLALVEWEEAGLMLSTSALETLHLVCNRLELTLPLAIINLR